MSTIMSPQRAAAPTDDMVHVTKWHNGEKRWSPFSASEFDRRCTRFP